MFSLLVVMALCTTQVLSEDQWGRAIRKKNFRKTLKEFETGSIQEAQPLFELIKNISAKQDDDCVLFDEGGKCLFKLQKVSSTTKTPSTVLRTPRHTESFPDAPTAKTFLKERILALVKKSYPTIAKVIEGFYSESTDSLLQKDETDSKLWSKRLSSSANLVNIRLAERMEAFIENVKYFKRPSLAILIVSILISLILFGNCVFNSVMSGLDRWRRAQNNRFDQYYNERQEQEMALQGGVRAIANQP